MSRPNAQSMKPATAAKKLDVYLPATPAEFQENPITCAELAAQKKYLAAPEMLSNASRKLERFFR